MPPLYCHKNRASLVGSPPAGLAPFLGVVSPVPPPDLSIKHTLKSSLLACAWSNFVHAPTPPCSLVIKFRSRTSSLLLICHQNLIMRQLILTHTWSNFVHASSKFDHVRGEKALESSNFVHVRDKKTHASSRFDHVRGKKAGVENYSEISLCKRRS